MSSTTEPVRTGSPTGSPPSGAIPPPGLTAARDKCAQARQTSRELRTKFEELKRVVEPEVAPDMEQPEPDRNASLKLATLGIELASQEKDTIQLERKVLVHELDAGLLQSDEADERHQQLNRRYLFAGDDLWRHHTKRLRLDDPGTVRLLEPRGNELSECLLAMYKKCDGSDKPRRRRSAWRDDAAAYYGTVDPNDASRTWCHVAGYYLNSKLVKAAHIVPFFMDVGSLGEILFGSRAPSLQRPGNALFLSDTIKSWFDKHHLLIVPVDATESPITRWRTDLVDKRFRKSVAVHGITEIFGRDIDGQELTFRNDNRPVTRFLYFHYIMTLVRIKDLQRPGWQDVWARYYTQPPFPTPGNYLRKSMLLAIATHFGTADMKVVESWITGHGFDTPLKLTDEEATEAARRVFEEVEENQSKKDKRSEDDPEDAPMDDPEDDPEDAPEDAPNP
ncbi:hypothetical protein MAJ_11217, partial [Metarhizium majus ARSEF 297]